MAALATSVRRERRSVGRAALQMDKLIYPFADLKKTSAPALKSPQRPGFSFRREPPPSAKERLLRRNPKRRDGSAGNTSAPFRCQRPKPRWMTNINFVQRASRQNIG